MITGCRGGAGCNSTNRFGFQTLGIIDGFGMGTGCSVTRSLGGMDRSGGGRIGVKMGPRGFSRISGGGIGRPV